jgi:riboflavin biosynthesis pyrimidine reductase
VVQRIYPDHHAFDTAEELVAAYAFPAVSPGSAFVRATMVSTLDGAAHGPDGQSASISSPADRAVFAATRGVADAILVGAQTARVEGYAAPAAGDVPAASLADAITRHRRQYGQASQPVIAVVSNSLRLDPGSALFAGVTPPSIVLTSEQSPSVTRDVLSQVADVVVAGAQSVEPDLAIAALASRGLLRIQCEGGPRLLAQFLEARLVDELCLTTTPLLAGGDAARIIDGQLTMSVTPELVHILEEDGTVFARWRSPVQRPAPRTSTRS